MQNEIPDTIEVNTGLNENPTNVNNNLREVAPANSIWQNPIRALQEQFQTLNPETRNTIKEFGNAMGTIILGVGNIYSIKTLAQKDRSDEEKKLAPLIATILATTDLLVATAIVLRLKRNRTNNQTNTYDGDTVALSADLRQEQEAMQDEELGNQQETAEETIEPEILNSRDTENDNNNEFSLSNLAMIPERTTSSNSLGSTMQNQQKASTEFSPKLRSFSI
ncbi:hypothetical protein [Ascidiimonas sp. W6]|uniref:hypothetical protein n=1 Tax=Ascidiimonas meishanensis TaxID=3128903 RepID=UPI0030EEB08E